MKNEIKISWWNILCYMWLSHEFPSTRNMWKGGIWMNKMPLECATCSKKLGYDVIYSLGCHLNGHKAWVLEESEWIQQFGVKNVDEWPYKMVTCIVNCVVKKNELWMWRLYKFS